MSVKAELFKMARVNELAGETRRAVRQGADGFYEVITREFGSGSYLFNEPVQVSSGVRVFGIGTRHDVSPTPNGTILGKNVVTAIVEIDGERAIISIDTNGSTTHETPAQEETRYTARRAPLLPGGQRREGAYADAGVCGLTSLEILDILYGAHLARTGRDLGRPDLDSFRRRWRAEMPREVEMPMGIPEFAPRTRV